MKSKNFTFFNFFGFMGVAMVFSLLVGNVSTSNAQATNMLINPSFEDANIATGWADDWGNNKLSTAAKRSGSKSLECGTGDGGRAQSFTTGFTIGSKYHLSGWCKLSAAGAGANIGVICEDAAAKQIEDFMSPVVTNTAAFAEYTRDFVVPNKTFKMIVYIYFYGGTNTVFLDDVTLTLVTTTGISSLLSGDVKLYPNPLRGQSLNISTPGISGEKSISIIDITGRLIYSQELESVDNQTIDLNNKLNKGLYFVKTSTLAGNYSQKLIVQ